MSTISTVAVDFIANVSKYLQGLKTVESQTKTWSRNTMNEMKAVETASKTVSIGISKLASAFAAFATISFARGAISELASIKDAAENASLSIKEFQELKFIASDTGTNIENVVNALNKLEDALQKAKSEGGKAADIFYRTGLSLETLLNATGFDRIKILADYVNEATDKQQAFADIAELIGEKTMPKLRSMLSMTSAELDNMAKVAKATGQVLDDSVVKTADRMEKKVDQGIAKWKNYLATILLVVTAENNTLFGMKAPNIENIYAKPLESLQKYRQYLDDLSMQKYMITLRPFGSKDTSAVDAQIKAAEEVIRDLEKIKQRIDGFDGSAKKAAETTAEVAASANKTSTELSTTGNAVARNIPLWEDFTKTLSAFSKLPLTERYSKLNDLIQKYNGLNDPGRQRELTKAREDLLAEVEKEIRAMEDATDAGAQYKKIQDLITIALKEKLTTDGKVVQILDNIGSKYREIYDPAEKYLRLQRELNGLPSGANVNILEVLRNSNKEFRDISRPLAELNNKLKESIAYFEALENTEVAALEKRAKGYEQEGTLSQERLDLIMRERNEIKKKYETEANIVRKTIIGEADVIYQREAALLLNDKQRAAQAQYNEELIRINKLLSASIQTEQGALRFSLEYSKIQEMRLQSEAKLFLARNEAIAQGFQYMSDFADQFSRAIVEGQNFGDALKNVFKSILKDITVLILRTAILQGIMAAIGFINPVAGIAFGQLTGQVPRARGGPVAMGGAYRVGEAGPETFVPSQNGYILPNDMQPVESTNVVQNIYVQTGVAQTVRAEMLQLLPRFKSEAMAGVLDARQRGGSYAKGISPV